MTDVYTQEVRGKPREHQQRPWGGPLDNQMGKVEGSTSATGGFSFGISGTTVTGTVTALTVVTPFIVLFSPVLVSVFVIVFLLATGFFTAREVGVAAKTGLARMYKYVTDANRNRIQEDSFDQETNKFGLRAREMKDRDERLSEGGRYETGGFDNTNEAEESSHNLVKAATAATTGTSLVVFSGLTFLGTVIALVLATPLLVLFSPVLVPALITVFLLASGLFASGGFSVAAVTTLGWLYKYVTNENPRGTNLFDQESGKQGSTRERMDFTSYIDEHVREEGTQGTKPRERRDLTRDIDAGEEGRLGFRYTTESGKGYNQVLKVATATTAGGSLLVFSGLTFVGTVIALTVATPLLVTFSPVLVPALITVLLLASGFFASGGFSVAAVTTLGWLYKYVTNENPRETNLFDRESGKQSSTRERMDFKRYIDEHVGEEGKQGAKPRERRDLTRDIDAGEEGRLGRESGKQGSTRERMDSKRYIDEHVGEEGKQDAKPRERRDLTRDIDAGEESRLGFHYTTESGKGYNQVLKAATATTAGGSLLVFSGLTFVGTVIALTVATPLLVIFSPVLVPALITMFLLQAGFLTSGGFGVAGMTVLSWIYKFVTSGNRTREDSFNQERHKLGSKSWETRDIGEHGIGEGYRVTNRDRVSPASHHQV